MSKDETATAPKVDEKPTEKPAEKPDAKQNGPHVGSLLVESIMTTEVFFVTMRMKVGEIIDLILTKKISGAPVLDQAERVVSVVSESDLIKFAALGGMDRPLGDFQDKLVKPKQLITVKRTDSFKEVFKKFLDHPVRRVIVVDSNGKLQGIVSRSNILKAFVQKK